MSKQEIELIGSEGFFKTLINKRETREFRVSSGDVYSINLPKCSWDFYDRYKLQKGFCDYEFADDCLEIAKCFYRQKNSSIEIEMSIAFKNLISACAVGDYEARFGLRLTDQLL